MAGIVGSVGGKKVKCSLDEEKIDGPNLRSVSNCNGKRHVRREGGKREERATFRRLRWSRGSEKKDGMKKRRK